MRQPHRLRAALGLCAIVAVSPAAGVHPGRAATTHVVRLTANRFVPAETRALPGDTIHFVNGNGGPHNVQFIADSMPAAARALLVAAMPAQIAPLSGPLLILQDENYTMVIPGLPPGRYAFLCQPHQTNMHGALVVSSR